MCCVKICILKENQKWNGVDTIFMNIEELTVLEVKLLIEIVNLINK